MTESLALIPSAAESQLNRNAAFEEVRDIVVALYLGIGKQRNRKPARDSGDLDHRIGKGSKILAEIRKLQTT
jgi:hypothetical protein